MSRIMKAMYAEARESARERLRYSTVKTDPGYSNYIKAISEHKECKVYCGSRFISNATTADELEGWVEYYDRWNSMSVERVCGDVVVKLVDRELRCL